MALFITLLDKYLFSGVPSNAAWDLIKLAWQKVAHKEWEQLYLDAFEQAVNDSREQLATYTDNGDIGLDRDSLYEALHQDLAVSIKDLPFSTIRNEEFTNKLARAMEARSALVIGGHNLSLDDYIQLLLNLQRHATSKFKQAILLNEVAFRRAMLEESLTSHDLLGEIRRYLTEQFDLTLGELEAIRGEISEFRSEFNERMHDLSARALTSAPPTALTIDQIEIEHVPATEGFVDREEELRSLSALLDKYGFVTIEGMPGSGKTWFGAKYAKQFSVNDVFWFTFSPRQRDNLEVALWDLGVFLGKRGNMSLWSVLTNPHLSATPLNVRIGVITHALRRSGYILCFDDFQLVNGDTEVGVFIDRIIELAKRKDVQLLLMTRHMPRQTLLESHIQMPGLNTKAVELLLRREGVSLPSWLIEQLHIKTEGLPEFVNMFLAWAKAHYELGPEALSEFIDIMPHFDVVWQYLTQNVQQTLSEAESEVLEALSVFRKPQSIEGISRVAPEEPPTVLIVGELVRRHLVIEVGPNRYRLHDLIKEFAYKIQAASKRRARHLMAARFLEKTDDKSERVEAAYHYIRGGKPENACDILTGKPTEWIDSGQSSGVLGVLDDLLASPLAERERITALETRGDLLKIVGQYLKARDAYQLMEQLARKLEDRASQAKAYRNMYRTYSTVGDYGKALEVSRKAEHLYKSLRDKPGLAAALNAVGAALWHQGHYDQAIESYQRSQDTFEQIDDVRGVAMCLNNIGEVHASMGDFHQAIDKFQASLEIKESIEYTHGLGISLANMSSSLISLGEYNKGLDRLHQAMKIREQIGYVEGYAKDLDSVARVRFLQAEFREAIRSYKEALQIQESISHKKDILSTRVGLGETLMITGQLGSGLRNLEEADQLAKEIGVRRSKLLASSMSCWGRMQVYGVDTRVTAACREAEELIVELGRDTTVRRALNVLAEADLTRGEFEVSLERLHRSKSAHKSSFEVEVQTDLLLAQVLLVTGYLEQSGWIIRELRSTTTEQGLLLYSPRIELLDAMRYWCLNDIDKTCIHLAEAHANNTLVAMPLLRWRLLFFVERSSPQDSLDTLLCSCTAPLKKSKDLLSTVSGSLEAPARPVFMRVVVDNEKRFLEQLRQIRETYQG